MKYCITLGGAEKNDRNNVIQRHSLTVLKFKQIQNTDVILSSLRWELHGNCFKDLCLEPFFFEIIALRCYHLPNPLYLCGKP